MTVLCLGVSSLSCEYKIAGNKAVKKMKISPKQKVILLCEIFNHYVFTTFDCSLCTMVLMTHTAMAPTAFSQRNPKRMTLYSFKKKRTITNASAINAAMNTAFPFTFFA